MGSVANDGAEVEPGGSLEWPSVLRNARIPATISEAAADALRASASQTAHDSLTVQRALCTEVQADLGARQLARYGVSQRLDEIAGVPVRIFTPRKHPGAGPVLLNLHGGGFTKDAGSVTENVPLAALAGATVIAVRYRLAPEFSFPAAVDDGETVYRRLLETSPPTSVGLYGTSSGANLCAQLLVRLQQGGLPTPSALGFFSGTADLARRGDTEHFFRPSLDEDGSENLFSAYLAGADPLRPEVSPIFANLGAFPPTLCIAGTRDFMLSQTSLFHRALLARGVEAELVVFEAMLHAHWIYLDIPESDEAFAHMARFFTRHLCRA